VIKDIKEEFEYQREREEKTKKEAMMLRVELEEIYLLNSETEMNLRALEEERVDLIRNLSPIR
jgi:hypothetical protein